MERIKAEVPGLNLNTWYLDDGTLCSPPSDLLAALRFVEQDGPPRDLKLNHAKSLLFIPEDSDLSLNVLPPDIPITRVGFSLLGCPIGPPSYCDEVVSKRIRQIKECLEKLTDLEDSQMETTLL